MLIAGGCKHRKISNQDRSMLQITQEELHVISKQLGKQATATRQRHPILRALP